MSDQPSTLAEQLAEYFRAAARADAACAMSLVGLRREYDNDMMHVRSECARAKARAFARIGAAAKTLKRNDVPADEVATFYREARETTSYANALRCIMSWVDTDLDLEEIDG